MAILSKEQYELSKWFLPNAKGIVVDVGANVGGYTVRACKQADLVIAIEPQKEVFELLRINVKDNCNRHNVILVKKAIGDRKGKIVLKIPKTRKEKLKRYGLASVLNIDTTKMEYEYEEVEVDTLDNIISSLNLSRINLLKVDIEGAEALAFRGMRRTLEITDKLMIEIQPGNEWLVDEFKKLGFKLVDRKGVNYFFVKG